MPTKMKATNFPFIETRTTGVGGYVTQPVSRCKRNKVNSHASWHTGKLQGGSNMTGTDLCVNKPHCAAAVRP